MKTRTLALSAVLLVAMATTLLAEKVNMSPAALKKTATHVVTGKVTAIYTRTEAKGDWRYTHYCAEVKVDKTEKGEGLDAGSLVYVRYWRKAWTGAARDMPAGTSGHRGLPTEGQTLRIYLAKNAYDGFGNDNKDGGFNVIGANGFEALK